MAIGLALVGTFTFYIVVTEFCVGNGNSPRAELRLLDVKIRVAQSPARTDDNKKINPETQGEIKWQMVEHN